MVEVRLRLMRAALARPGPAPEWFWFGSESDGPIGSCKAAHAHLASHPGKSFNLVDRETSAAQRRLSTALRAQAGAGDADGGEKRVPAKYVDL